MTRVRRRRRQPKQLARKLLAIRLKLGLSQPEMAKLLDLQVSYTVISAYERKREPREPDLITLLRYAELVGVSTDVLIDDTKDLP